MFFADYSVFAKNSIIFGLFYPRNNVAVDEFRRIDGEWSGNGAGEGQGVFQLHSPTWCVAFWAR